jgi:hypothetical protein
MDRSVVYQGEAPVRPAKKRKTGEGERRLRSACWRRLCQEKLRKIGAWLLSPPLPLSHLHIFFSETILYKWIPIVWMNFG